MKRRNLPGFTLLEILVVVVAVGILAAVGIYMLNITRSMNRDNKRVSDVAVLRAGLTQYWLQKAGYPQSDPVDLGAPGAGVDRLTVDGFVPANSASSPVYLSQVPVGPKGGEYYRYHGSAQGYSIRFATERQTAYGTAGTYYAHADGINQTDDEE